MFTACGHEFLSVLSGPIISSLIGRSYLQYTENCDAITEKLFPDSWQSE